MNFKKLQAMQLELDNSILSTKPQMTAEERFNKTLVALSMEVAEVANCAEHFKFWKDNKGKVDEKRFYCIPQTQREGIEKPEKWCELSNQAKILTRQQAHKLTLVEEASDCLHFILSLANQQNETLKNRKIVSERHKTIEDVYKEVAAIVCSWYTQRLEMDRYKDKFLDYISRLGITTKELEQAYYEKNEENYRRLREGY